jgi:hypothetical protein
VAEHSSARVSWRNKTSGWCDITNLFSADIFEGLTKPQQLKERSFMGEPLSGLFWL